MSKRKQSQKVYGKSAHYWPDNMMTFVLAEQQRGEQNAPLFSENIYLLTIEQTSAMHSYRVMHYLLEALPSRALLIAS